MDVAEIAIEILDSAPSTMDAARARVLAGGFAPGAVTPTCSCVVALEQTAGRGQRGRSWYAERGCSLCATYMLHCPPVTDPATSGCLGLLAGVAAADAIQRYGLGHKIGLKWPNDVQLNGKKAGGILIELVRSPAGPWVALVGIGLNLSIAQFPDDLAASATSLLSQGVDAGAIPDVERAARDVGGSLAGWAKRGRSGAAGVIERWRELDATRGRRFQADWNGATGVGTAEGIDDEGALLLRLDNGAVIAVTSASSLREAIPAR
jgi:BirA family biotin operon repressor/biotin-[acetyl-CoA-carboxylase] ligase